MQLDWTDGGGNLKTPCFFCDVEREFLLADQYLEAFVLAFQFTVTVIRAVAR